METKKLKITLSGTDTTRVIPSYSPSTGWLNLERLIRDRFLLTPDHSLALTYTDVEGDSITVSSTLELDEAYATPSTTLRFTLRVNGGPTAFTTDSGTTEETQTEHLPERFTSSLVLGMGQSDNEEEDAAESDLFSEIGSDESLEELEERVRGDKGKEREKWDYVGCEEVQDAKDNDAAVMSDVVAVVEDPTPEVVKMEPASMVSNVADPVEEDLKDLPTLHDDSADPAEVPLPSSQKDSTPPPPIDPFAPLFASLSSAFPSLPLPSSIPGLDPTTISRIASLISLAPLAPLHEVPSLVRDIGMEVTTIVGAVFKGFREEAESVREEFRVFKGEMEKEVERRTAEAEGQRESKDGASAKEAESTRDGESIQGETQSEKKSRRLKKKLYKALKAEVRKERVEARIKKHAAKSIEVEVEEEKATRTQNRSHVVPDDPSSPPPLSAPALADDFFFRRTSKSMPVAFDAPPPPPAPVNRPDPFGFATPAFRRPTPPPSRTMPGSFRYDGSTSLDPAGRPRASTSRLPDQWAEVTPADLRQAVTEMGMDDRDLGVNIVIERVWEEMRGKRIEEMVEEVVERLL